jgi:hypothetical protein
VVPVVPVVPVVLVVGKPNLCTLTGTTIVLFAEKMMKAMNVSHLVTWYVPHWIQKGGEFHGRCIGGKSQLASLCCNQAMISDSKVDELLSRKVKIVRIDQ